jgi:hypothetical protein
MARVPGTETPKNRAGLTPGLAVRCRRSLANATRTLADRRGFVCEVRTGHVRVLLETSGHSVWMEGRDLLAEPLPEGSDLDLLRRVFVHLNGRRLEFELSEISVFSEGFPAAEIDAVRELFGNRLTALIIAAHGVHEVAVSLKLRTRSP